MCSQVELTPRRRNQAGLTEWHVTTYFDYFVNMLSNVDEFIGKFETTAYLVVDLGAKSPADGSTLAHERYTALCNELEKLCQGEGETVLPRFVAQTGANALAFIVFRVPQGQTYRDADSHLRSAIKARLPECSIEYLEQEMPHPSDGRLTKPGL